MTFKDAFRSGLGGALILVLWSSVALGKEFSNVPASELMDRIRVHTYTENALDSDVGFYLALRHIPFRQIGLSTKDLRVLETSITGRQEIIELFEPISSQIKLKLAAKPVDAVAVGVLLAEAQEAEKSYKSKRCREAIAGMSNEGVVLLQRARQQYAAEAMSTWIDFAALAQEFPEYVIATASRFVRSMENADSRGGGPITKTTEDGQWRTTLR